MKYSKLFLLALAAGMTGCASKPEITTENNKAGTEWNIAMTEDALAGHDPIEGWNRSMFAVNDVFMRYLVRPVGWVYTSILPSQAVDRIDYASTNLAFPGRFFSCVFQAKFKGGGIVFVRFLTNSTVGIAGLFDPADAWLGLPYQDENMGKAFACWGFGPGCVLILPCSSATNVRDQVGGVFDYALDLKMILPYISYLMTPNRIIRSYDSYNAIVESQPDLYEIFKLALTASRYVNLEDTKYHLMKPQPSGYGRLRTFYIPASAPLVKLAPEFHPVNPLVDTLKVGMFNMQRNDVSWWKKLSVWNTDFTSRGTIRSVQDRRYQFWNEADQPVPRNGTLVIIVPGIGSHYTAATQRSLAELLSDHGYAVAATTNTMNWSFANTPETAFPGYIPDGVKSLRSYLRAVLDDLRKNEKYTPKRVVVLGYSLGGLQTLHLAKMESENNTLGVDRFAAVNPPADLMKAVTKFDELAAVSKVWTREEYFRQMADAFCKYMYLSSLTHAPLSPEMLKANPELAKKYAMPLTPEQSAALFNISFRLTIRELVAAAHMRKFANDVPQSRFNREALYKYADSLGGRGYIEKYVLPRHPGKKLEDLNFESGLYSIEKNLRANPKVRVLHNLDDPFLTPADCVYLDKVLGNRLTWFDCGAHMGNMYLTLWQEKLIESVGK